MRAVWLVRSRQLMSRMGFWTALIGYDPRDRSLSHRIYLIYVFIFFSLWGFAMLALVADQAAWILTWFRVTSPIQASILLITVILLADALLRGYRYARQSPFNFTEEDSVLICQTPVDRRQVALAWLFGDWIPAGLPYWAGIVMLSFACQQLASPAGMSWVHLPIYLLTGIRAASIMLPLHLAFMTSTYVFGTLRLRRDKELAHLRLIPLGVGACLILLTIFFPASLRILLWLILYLLQSGLGTTSWIAGFVLAVFLATLSLMVLFLVSPELNLSRASQESNFQWDFQQAGFNGGQS